MRETYVRKSGLNRIAWFILVAWLLPALACNFPGFRNPASEVDVKELQQTFAARITHTPSAPVTVPGVDHSTPPGESPTAENPQNFPTPEQKSTPDPLQGGQYNYLTRSGDTLTALANRFQVEPAQIYSSSPIPQKSFLPAGIPVWIQTSQVNDYSAQAIFPDGEVTYSPASLDFELETFISSAGGYLRSHSEVVNGELMSGAEIISQVAQEASVNPRVLLAFLEHRSGWVFGELVSPQDLDYPLGFRVTNRRGLYQELVMAATHLNLGYYGWRSGELKTLKFSDGSTRGINPWLNPGSVGLQNLFAKFYSPKNWSEVLYGENNFLDFYYQSFGDPWERDGKIEPFLTPDLSQPALELPFIPGERWSLTGGPHASWNTGSPRGAIDFAPVTGEPACTISRAWVTASTAGVITRSANNVVALDLDGDGKEQTGWVMVYLHLAEDGRVQAGQYVNLNDRLGHPSCERGQSTGTHVHMARKFNGEWLPADYPAPMILSGWQVHADERNYQGRLVNGDQTVTASPVGPRTSIIVR